MNVFPETDFLILTHIGNTVASLTAGNGVFEIGLCDWSGFLNRASAQGFIADLRRFCDEADAALARTDPQPKEESK